MKKILMPFFMAFIVMAIAGCADNNNDGLASPSFDSSIITTDENITIVQASSDEYAWGDINLRNPRTGTGSDQYYPILLGITKGTHYRATLTSSDNVDKYDGDLTFKHSNYDLNNATPITNSGKYHLAIVGKPVPNDGAILIAFLTKNEAKKYLGTDINQAVIDKLNELGLLRQYKWTKAAN